MGTKNGAGRTGLIKSAAAAALGALAVLAAATGGPPPRAQAAAPDVAAGDHQVPASYQANVDGANWSGYAAIGASFSSVSASWSAPAVKCGGAGEVVGPWVGLGGITSSSVQQTGLEVSCASGSPTYRAWYEMAPQAPVYYADPIRQGDRMTATVQRVGTEYSLQVTDATRGWTRTARVSAAQGDNGSAEVILESPTGRFPNFGQFTFTGVTVDGKSLGSFRPVALDASNNGVRQDHTGPLSGTGFTVGYQHQ